MPKLTIDNQSIEVPKGTNVMTAADQLGIMIPRFCYHPALGAVGACRVCAVKFEKGPLLGIQMSCMVEAADDMQVSTTDPEAVDFRRHVIEWLMLNHPHDCPVCDEGGHCLLQDMTISGGHGLRRYQGRKRTYVDQYLGPLVAHEMNRCIQCYRCVRLYREYCGYTDFGAMGSAARVYYGRETPGTLESPFAGNLIDICPTGVFTDRPSRHKGRRWDFERTASICTHCSLGCNVIVSVRNREVVRREARFNRAVNGDFICDRGRYGFAFANAESRPRTARIHGTETDLETTQTQLTAELNRIVAAHGSEAVALIGSGRSSLETLLAIKNVCQVNGYRPPVLFSDPHMSQAVLRAAARFSSDLTVSIQDLADADLIILVGADPLNEAPMAALALRKAFLNGAQVAVVDPRPIELPLEFHHLKSTPDTLAVRLAGLIQAGLKQEVLAQMPEFMETIAALESVDVDLYEDNGKEGKIDAEVVKALKQSTRPVIVCGTHICDPLTLDLAGDAVDLLRRSGKKAGLLFQFPEANSLGVGLMMDRLTDPETLLQEMEAGQIKALIAIETDPLVEMGQHLRLQRTLNQVELLVGIDYVAGPFASKAHFFLPAATVDECGGTFINTHGLAQTAPSAYSSGRPIIQTGAGNHPPRTFSPHIPGGGLRSAATYLLHLVDKDLLNLNRLMVEAHDAFAPMARAARLPSEGLRLSIHPSAPSKLKPALPEAPSSQRKSPKSQLMLLMVEWTFGTERCACLSPFLMQRAESPYLTMHPSDAHSLGLTASPKVVLSAAEGSITVPLRITKKVARGVVVLPCHCQLNWQSLGHRRIQIDSDQLNAPAKQ